MQNGKLMKWELLFQKLKEPTRVCKLCFKDIQENDLMQIVSNNAVCSRCYEEIIPKFRKFKVDDVKGLAIYDYDEKIQSLIYQLKGCFDIEIAQIFLERFKRELRFRYMDYCLIPVPSFEEEDIQREFNHVVEIFKSLKLTMLNIVVKTKPFKQALNTKRERRDIKRYLSLKENLDLSKKKILIVDDVFTTGSTVRAVIELIKTLHPKKIEVLVISKTIFKESHHH